MAQRVVDNCVVSVTVLHKLKFYILALFVGLYVWIKKFVISFWRSESDSSLERYAPLPCLIDNTIGQHSYVKLKGVKLHYVECGNPNLPVALLLHGFPDCWLGWRHQMKILAPFFRVVAVDLKGFGDSDKPLWRSSYKPQDIVRELEELVYTLGVERCAVIGHDLGAHLGWYLATQCPDLVVKFVAMSAPHPNVAWDYLPPSSIFNSRWLHLCQLPVLPEAEARRSDIWLVDECFAHLRGTKEEKLVSAYKYVFARPEDWTGPINYHRTLPLSRIKEGVQVHVPVLLIVGNKDPLIQLEGVVKSTEYADKFLLKIVDGAGHFPHQECPEHVNKLILSFLTVAAPVVEEKVEPVKGLIGSLYSNTVRYGNSLVDGVKKKTNGVVRLPSHMLKQA